MKKVNLGCGPVSKEDWINLDWGILAFVHRFGFLEKVFNKIGAVPQGYKTKWPTNIRLCDCRRRLPFGAGSVDFIYTSHFLEHLKRFEAERVLKECFRVLKQGGILRVAVPDLKKISDKYIRGDREFFLNYAGKNEIEKLERLSLADLFNTMFYPEFYRSRPVGLARFCVNFIRPHLWMYDFESLSRLLKESGFKTAQERQFKEGSVPDLDCLDLFPEITLYAEAKK